jgi:NTE family protein
MPRHAIPLLVSCGQTGFRLLCCGWEGNAMLTVRQLFSLFPILVLVSGCASYGVVQNSPKDDLTDYSGYSLHAWSERANTGTTAMTVALSGGGTRAAALAYGVLAELRDTPWRVGDRSATLLDAVDQISSVSGGSFTAAYYGLHGDRMFDDFEDKFLKKDIEGALVKGLLNPFRWFGSTGRTEMAVKLYEKELFGGATYADMINPDRPLIIVNASDLGYGVRFSFIQEYFNLLCSDLSTFPVARAVAASSAVPIVFNPVVIENYSDCGSDAPEWLVAAKARAETEKLDRLEVLTESLESYLDKDRRKYAHFVDGGITDNLGLLAMFDVISVSGGPGEFLKTTGRIPPERLVILSVDASTEPEPEMDTTNRQPSVKETIGAMSDIQLHRYNVATDALMKWAANRWAEAISTPERPVEVYLIRVALDKVEDPDDQAFFNAVPTSFSLTEEQVDRLIQVGREQLRGNSEFQRLLADARRESDSG